MSKGFFSYLNWAVPKTRADSERLKYVNSRRNLFPEGRRRLDSIGSPYEIIRSFILLRSLERKNLFLSILSSSLKDSLEANLSSYRNLFKALPYFSYHQIPIYFPFYSPFINQRLSSDPLSFYSFPYDAFLSDSSCSLINPLFEYGSHIFERSQTGLIKLPVKDIDSSCFYLEKEGILLFIDSSGYLETRIPFFDDSRKEKDFDRLPFRLSLIAEDYYSNDFARLSKDLIKEKLLSPDIVLSAIKNKERQYKEKNEDDL